MKPPIESLKKTASRRAFFACGLALAFISPVTLQHAQAAAGDGTVQGFKCIKKGLPDTVGVKFIDVSKAIGFGGSTKALQVLNSGSSKETSGGCLLANLRRANASNIAFTFLELLFKVPDSPQNVEIGACFDTPNGIYSTEVPLSKFDRRSLSGGWSEGALDAKGFGLPHEGKGCSVKSIWVRLIGYGNIEIGNTKINYAGAKAVHPKNLNKTIATCPEVCPEAPGRR